MVYSDWPGGDFVVMAAPQCRRYSTGSRIRTAVCRLFRFRLLFSVRLVQGKDDYRILHPFSPSVLFFFANSCDAWRRMAAIRPRRRWRGEVFRWRACRGFCFVDVDILWAFLFSVASSMSECFLGRRSH